MTEVHEAERAAFRRQQLTGIRRALCDVIAATNGLDDTDRAMLNGGIKALVLGMLKPGVRVKIDLARGKVTQIRTTAERVLEAWDAARKWIASWRASS